MWCVKKMIFLKIWGNKNSLLFICNVCGLKRLNTLKKNKMFKAIENQTKKKKTLEKQRYADNIEASRTMCMAYTNFPEIFLFFAFVFTTFFCVFFEVEILSSYKPNTQSIICHLNALKAFYIPIYVFFTTHIFHDNLDSGLTDEMHTLNTLAL